MFLCGSLWNSSRRGSEYGPEEVDLCWARAKEFPDIQTRAWHNPFGPHMAQARTVSRISSAQKAQRTLFSSPISILSHIVQFVHFWLAIAAAALTSVYTVTPGRSQRLTENRRARPAGLWVGPGPCSALGITTTSIGS